MDPDQIPDLLTGAIDGLRAAGDERTASQLETFAPLVGQFVAQLRAKRVEGRSFFIADMACRMLQGELENALDSSENMLPKVRQAVKLAALVLSETDRLTAVR